jgi:glutamate synthase (NADPH/NADH)
MERGIAKVMAKMGISTLQSYKGAQIFEAVGIADEVIDKCFRGTPSRIGGVTFKVLAEETFERHALTYQERDCDMMVLRNPGQYHWRSGMTSGLKYLTDLAPRYYYTLHSNLQLNTIFPGGEKHVNDPMSIANLQEAVKNNSKSAYEKYVESAMENVEGCALRGQLSIVLSDSPVDISEVEPAGGLYQLPFIVARGKSHRRLMDQ